MGSFGDHLRREREMRGISLDEIATATKISARNLRALEEEKFAQLPGGIFNKGFVRSYAKFLGIDEDQMVAEYVTASQDIESVREQKMRTDLSKVEFKHDDEERREISLEPTSQWGTIAVIVLIAVAAFGGYRFYQKKKAERAQAQVRVTPVASATAPATQAPQSAPPATSSANSAATLPSSNAANQQPQPSTTAQTNAPKQPVSDPMMDVKSGQADSHIPGVGPIDVKIHANQDSWVSITADGKTVMKGTLAADSEKAVRANNEVVVVLGNVGGVELSYNGKPVENLGKGQDVKKITFTTSGYE